MPKLTFADYTVVFIYSMLILGAGFYFLKRQMTTDDYLIISQRNPSWTMGFALLSTLVSNIIFYCPCRHMKVGFKYYKTSLIDK